jgi:hypothetical protein
MSPKREQRLVIARDDASGDGLRSKAVVLNSILYRQEVFQSVVAPLYVAEQGLTLVCGQCVGCPLQLEFNMAIGP